MTIRKCLELMESTQQYIDDRGASGLWMLGRCTIIQLFFEELFKDMEVSHLSKDEKDEWLQKHLESEIPRASALHISIFLYHELGGMASPQATEDQNDPFNRINRACIQGIIDSLYEEAEEKWGVKDFPPTL